MNMNMFIAITRCLLPWSGAKAMRWETAPFGIVQYVELGVYNIIGPDKNPLFTQFTTLLVANGSS